MKMASSTPLWYIRASKGRYLFQWDSVLDEGLAFVQVGVPTCLDDVTRANFKCDVADVNKQIHTDFRAVNSKNSQREISCRSREISVEAGSWKL